MPPKWQRWKGIMKAYPFEEKRLLKWTPPFIVQPKYDGVRCRAVPMEQGGYILLSSEENVIFSVPHINTILQTYGIKHELDGELYCHGMSFDEIVSITSRTVNLHPDYREMNFHIFDVIDDQPQMRRTIYIESFKGVHPKLQIAPFWLCENLQDVMKVYNDLIGMKYEGIIVRHPDAPYVKRRSTFVMKFKPKQSDEYKVTSYVEEVSVEGVPKNRLGSLVCASGDGNLFNVGTGFTDQQREDLWDTKDLLAGMTVKVEYQHITSGKKVPRFPVFVEVVP